VALEILGLIAASAGASYGFWKLQRRRERKLLDVPRDPDLEVVLGVAQHEAQARGHAHVWPLHLIYGLAQDEAFTAAIARLGGDAAKLETYAQEELDKRREPHDERAMAEGGHAVGVVFMLARSHGRAAKVADLWSRLVRTDAAKAAAGAAGIDAIGLLFVLMHGMPEPSTDLADRTDVHVVLRNDDYTTQEFVVAILRDVFELGETEATTRMWETHKQGRSVVGRYKVDTARTKIATVRQRARGEGFPLWIGVEDC
jgi:ATP-dependent Clp protease adaptor protein ClpS